MESEQIVIEFDSGALITISLRAKDLAGMEGTEYEHSVGTWRNGSLWTPMWTDDWKRRYPTSHVHAQSRVGHLAIAIEMR
jgi:hypothetical protein